MRSTATKRSLICFFHFFVYCNNIYINKTHCEGGGGFAGRGVGGGP